MDGLLPLGYIEAEAYGRDLDRLTGHAETQNALFIENLDNFILTNFLDFQLWRDGQQHATANIGDSPENLEALLDRFFKRRTDPNHLARSTRKVSRQTDAGTPDSDCNNTHR